MTHVSKLAKTVLLPSPEGRVPEGFMPEGLDPDSILAAEFDYIAQAAFQATEDRARVASYYLVTVGSLVAAILGAQLQNMQVLPVYLGFMCLFLILCINGILTILQLARLRQSWYESMLAMNQIKDFYLHHFPAIEPALRWKTSTLPKRFKTWSVSYMLACQVAALGGGALAAAAAFAGLAFNFPWVLPAAGSGALFFLSQMIIYRRLLLHP